MSKPYLIPIKHDPSIRIEGNRPAQAASSMKRQKLYANAARILLRWGKLAQARHMLQVWHRERTFWAHLVGVAV